MAELPAPGRFSSDVVIGVTHQTLPVCRLSVIALLCVFFSGFANAGEQRQADHAEALEQLRERISSLKGELDSMRGQRDIAQDALEKAEKEIGVVAGTLHALDRKARRVRRDITDSQHDFDTGQADLGRLHAALVKELRLAYMAGEQERVKLLLNQEEPAVLGRLMIYHDYFIRARTRAMQTIRATLERLAGIEQQLVLQRGEIQGLIEQQQEISSRLLVRQSERHKILTQLQDNLSSKTDRLAGLEQDEQRLQKLVGSLQQAISDIPAAEGEYASLISLKGKLRWPVAGHISTRYGERHSSGKLHSRGVHITSRSGADVRAVARGRVVFADWLRGFGLLMIIDHGENYMSLYGQNRSLYRDVGEWVDRDEVVAAAGNSGGQAKAGVYLELRKDGRPFNPGRWFYGKPDALQAEGPG